MLVEAIEIKIKRNEAIKYFSKKVPIMSKISQFNKRIRDVELEYIEFKVLNYEIISRSKSNNCFRNSIKKHNIIMLVNTYNGYSESIESPPITGKRYIAKSCIRKARAKDDYVIEIVKNQIINFLGKDGVLKNSDKIEIQDISIKEVKTIYKPYWTVNFDGRNLLIDA